MSKIKLNNIIFWIISFFIFIASAYWFYISDLLNDYKGNNLNSINISVDIEWWSRPYSISKTFKSRSDYNISSWISYNKLNLQIDNISNNWVVWVEIVDNDWVKKPYLFNIKPSDAILDNLKNSISYSFTINWYNDLSFSWNIIDNEAMDNTIKSTWLKLDNRFIWYYWDYIFTINGSRIEKRLKNFEILNDYIINLPWSLNISNLTDFKVLDKYVYLRFSDWSICKGNLNDSMEYDFTLEPYSYSDIWISNATIMSPLSINETEGTILDYEVIWKYLYVLTDQKFKLYYLASWEILDKELIYSVNNNANLKSFFVNKSIYLLDDNWNISIVNNDFVIYRLNNANNSNIYAWSSKDINVYSSFKTENNITTNASIDSKTAEDLILNTKYKSVDGKPLYNDNNLLFNINKADFNEISLSKEYKLSKFSSNLWNFNEVSSTINIKVPIIGYWVTISKDSWNINPQLNYDLNSIFLKPYLANSWEYYLHIKAYDLWYNSSSEIIKWPLLIDNDKPYLSSISLLNNLDINIISWDSWNFAFNSSKKLSELSIIAEDNLNNISTYNLSNTSHTENYEWFKYIFQFNIQSWIKTIKFNIIWKDEWWNIWSIAYEYNVSWWWFQVLGLAETNVWISNSISKNQVSKWFMLGVSSKTILSKSEVNSDFFISKNNTVYNIIPFITNELWDKILDENKLKLDFPEFVWKVKKDVYNSFFYNWSSFNNNLKLLNGYYYVYSWDITFENLNYEWDAIIIINWNLQIKWDILKNKIKETEWYKNNLRIYVTGDVNIESQVNTIDSELYIWWALNTLANN